MFFPISEMPPNGMIFSLEANGILLFFVSFGRKNPRLDPAQAKKPKRALPFRAFRGAKAAKPAMFYCGRRFRRPPTTLAAKRRAL